ncbi:MAG: TrkA family potassium uptake protein [Austwickia sp.]|nr:TrkA family potassium uptake protein [Actinomycetota bacterium]MCO5307704.1 TrkA family potassium uptake protein [Austwickia sp.]
MSARDRGRSPQSILIIGLGRFGSAVALALIAMGKEVLAVDENADLVQRWAADLTHVVQADSTNDEALRQLGVRDFDRAVVAIGSDIEASVLTVLALAELGVKDIWAKAITAKHGAILERVGAHHVIYPEREMGEKVAHMIVTAVHDYIEFGGYALARIQAPTMTWGVPLGDSGVRAKYRVTVVGVKEHGQGFTYAEHSTIVHPGDELLVTGSVPDVEVFSQLPSKPPRVGG